MKACTEYQSLIIEVAGGAAGEGDRLRLEDHMAMCEACSAEFARLCEVLELARPTHSDPGDAYWDGYYGRVMQRLDAEAASPPLSRAGIQQLLNQLVAGLSAPRWALQLAVAVLLVVSGIAIGRSMFAPEAPGPVLVVPGTGVDPIQRAALETRTHEYLDRSKTLLLGFVNFDVGEDDPGMLNVERRRQIAGDLVTEATLLQEQLSASDQQRLRQLVADLEVILMQIANIESTYNVPEIEMLQDGVDRKGILFKIEVEEMRRPDGATPDARPASAKPVV